MTLTLPHFPRRLLATLTGIVLLATLALADTAHGQGQQITGAQAHLLWHRYDPADVDLQMDKARAAGAGILRVDVGWASIEQDANGQYNQWYLKRLDAVVDKAEARGLKLLLTFWETPCWASTAPASIKQDCAGNWWERRVQRYAPIDAREYAEALSFVVSRYRGRVAAWEIWNEPNHNDYFKADDVVGRYADLVKAGYPAAKAADPDATILAGSLADADFDFTRALLDRGVGGHFDAWSVHPYSGDRSPLDPGPDRWIQNSFVRGVPKVRETLLQAGENKPIWLTEFGWSTCTYRDGPSYANCVSFDRQAEYLAEAYNQMRSWDYVPVGIWFNMIDTSDAPGDRLENYGLLRVDGSEKPAYGAFATASRAAASGPAGDAAATEAPADAPASEEARPQRTRRVTLRVARKRGSVVVRGSGPARGKVVVRAYRYAAPSRGFAARPSYSISVSVGRDGRFKRVLRNPRLRKGRWRLTVAAADQPSRLARAYLRGR